MGSMNLRPKNPMSLFAATAAALLLATLAGCTGAGSGGGSDAAASLSQDAAAEEERVTIAGLEPATGSLGGGTEVTISGAGLADVASVSFGSVPAASFTVVDETSLTAVTPTSVDFAVTSVPVTVALDDGTQITSEAAFGYEIQTPVDSQLNYAFTYWKDYNLAEWGQFPDNDCGNFVNQAMLARGWTQSPDWFSEYATTGDYSLSWIRGNEMDAYYDSRPDTTRLELTQRDQVKIGDVVMFDWDPQNDNGVDHTMMVSQVVPNLDGTIAVKLVGHTLDAQYRDLDTAITVEKPGGTAHFWSIA
jgi:hypothetical protein